MSFPTRPRKLSRGSHQNTILLSRVMVTCRLPTLAKYTIGSWHHSDISTRQTSPLAITTPRPSPSRRKYRGRCHVGLSRCRGVIIFSFPFFSLAATSAHRHHRMSGPGRRSEPGRCSGPGRSSGPDCNPGAGRRWKPKVWQVWDAGHFSPSPPWGFSASWMGYWVLGSLGGLGFLFWDFVSLVSFFLFPVFRLSIEISFPYTTACVYGCDFGCVVAVGRGGDILVD